MKLSIPFLLLFCFLSLVGRTQYDDLEGVLTRKLTEGEIDSSFFVELDNVLAIYEKERDTTGAIRVFERIHATRGVNLSAKGAALFGRAASSFRDHGFYDQVELLYLDLLALRKAQQGQWHPNFALSLSAFARFYEDRKDFVTADSLYRLSFSVADSVLDFSHPYYANILFEIGQFYHNVNIPERSVPVFLTTRDYYLKRMQIGFQDMGEHERDQFYRTLHDYFDTFKNFTIQNALSLSEWEETWMAQVKRVSGYSMDQDLSRRVNYLQNQNLLGELYDLQLATKSILLNTANEIKHQILNSGDRVLIDLYYEVQALKKANGIGGLSDSLRHVLVQKDRDLSIYSSFYRNTEGISWKQIQQKLGASEAAVEIIRLRARDFSSRQWADSILYVALVLDAETKNSPDLILLKDGRFLEEKAITFYSSLINSWSKDLKSYENFWGPLKKRLEDKEKIHISLDGVYNSINLGTLYDPMTEKYLMEEKEIIQVTNTASMLKEITKEIPFNLAVLLGDPDFGRVAKTDIKNSVVVQALPGTEREITEISNLLKARDWQQIVLSDTMASEENLLGMLRPKVLHIATHGFFLASDETSPMNRSGLLLADVNGKMLIPGTEGVLTAQEALNLNIEGTELVVLSACETGLGEVRNGEGVYGLQRALMIAGAKNIIFSLWKVHDQVTTDLMVKFYEEWLSGVPKRQAFLTAQKQIKEHHSQPYYWGAFVLIGE